MIKGITVTLYEETQTGVDPFGAPIKTETPVEVPGVVVAPVGSDDALSTLNLTGRKAEYELYLPKGDTHVWENRRVEFFGQSFRAFGIPQEYIEANVPLRWNRRIRVERYE